VAEPPSSLLLEFKPISLPKFGLSCSAVVSQKLQLRENKRLYRQRLKCSSGITFGHVRLVLLGAKRDLYMADRRLLSAI